MSFLREFLRCERGGPAAELALLLPLLVLMLFGALEMGYYLYNEHQVVKGVRDGARYAARQSFVTINCNTGYSMPSATETAIKEVTRTGRPSGGTARVVGWVNADVDVDVRCDGVAEEGIYAEEAAAPIVTVTAQVDYESLFNGIGVVSDTFSLNATQEAAVMGI